MRSIKRIPFLEKEIWYIIKACSESFSLLNSHQLILDLDLKHIMVIPEGKIKIYWHQIEPDNTHLNFYQKIKQIPSTANNSPFDQKNREFRFHD